MSGEMETTPELADVLRDVLDSWKNGIHTAGPGAVTAYDLATQTASVQPQIKQPLRQRAGGHVLEQLPLLTSVPVMHFRSGSAWVHLPIALGDFVLLVYCERDINEWRRLGSVVDAADLRTHGLFGAVAIPGLFPRAQALAGLDGTSLEFGIGAMSMRLKATGLEVGTATKALALAEKVDAIANTLNTHVHGGVTTGAGSSGALVTPYAGGPSGSTQAKVGA